MSIKAKLIILVIILTLFSAATLGVYGRHLAPQTSTTALVFFTLVANLVIATVFAYVVIRPLDHVIIGTQLVAAGDLEHTLEKESDDEIGRVVEAFNEMVERLNAAQKHEARAERQAQTERHKAELIIDSMAEAVIVTDKDKNVISCNPAAEKLFNVTKDKVLGKNILHYSNKYNIGHLFFSFEDAETPWKKNKPIVEEFEIKEPKRQVFRATLAPLREGKGPVEGVVALIEDITKLRELDEMKTEFVSTVSHELRTPLTSIKGFSVLLADEKLGDLNKVQQKSVKIINEETERLAQLVDDILDLSKLEQQKYRMRIEKVDLNECIKSCPTIMLAKRKNIEVIYELKENVPSIDADKQKIMQVLTNLLSNAVKFTKKGGTITLATTHKKNTVALKVTDTGIGIAKKDIPRLFDKFYQAQAHLTRSHGGTGLGLAIVKEIVNLHNGIIEVQSKRHKGTTFTMTLPVEHIANDQNEYHKKTE